MHIALLHSMNPSRGKREFNTRSACVDSYEESCVQTKKNMILSPGLSMA